MLTHFLPKKYNRRGNFETPQRRHAFSHLGYRFLTWAVENEQDVQEFAASRIFWWQKICCSLNPVLLSSHGLLISMSLLKMQESRHIMGNYCTYGCTVYEGYISLDDLEVWWAVAIFLFRSISLCPTFFAFFLWCSCLVYMYLGASLFSWQELLCWLCWLQERALNTWFTLNKSTLIYLSLILFSVPNPTQHNDEWQGK